MYVKKLKYQELNLNRKFLVKNLNNAVREYFPVVHPLAYA